MGPVFRSWVRVPSLLSSWSLSIRRYGNRLYCYLPSPVKPWAGQAGAAGWQPLPLHRGLWGPHPAPSGRRHPLLAEQARRARSRVGAARGSAADENACAEETAARRRCGRPDARPRSAGRAFDTDTPPPAAGCPQVRGRPRLQPRACAGGSRTRARGPRASSQTGPPHPHPPRSPGPARTADSVPGRVPLQGEGQVRRWGREGLKALGPSSPTGPYLPMGSPPGMFRGAVAGGLGRPASFGASPISPKLSGARRPRVGPSNRWACLASLRQMRELPRLWPPRSRWPESPGLCHPIVDCAPHVPGLQIAHSPRGETLGSRPFYVPPPFFLLFH